MLFTIFDIFTNYDIVLPYCCATKGNLMHRMLNNSSNNNNKQANKQTTMATTTAATTTKPLKPSLEMKH
jgi:hypothetical protein